MKKLLYSTIFLSFATAATAQLCPANDSTQMGSTNDVFYSLSQFNQTGNGTVKTVANNDWHMAISVQWSNFPMNPANGVAIRYNAPLGENPQTGATGWKLVKLPNATATNWRAIDTAGLFALPELTDSDSTWNLSSFTSGYPSAGPFNFNWGTYNQVNHNIESNNVVFVLFNKSANQYKKIHVKELTADSLWHIILSNIDNSDSVYLNINKHDYSKRLFVYYNVLTNQITDREPDNDKWDLVWTKYRGMIDFNGTKVPYNVTGVLANNGIKIAKNLGKKCNEVWLRNKTAAYQNNISAIGYDWKTFDNQTFKYTITDTFVYFINKTTSTDTSDYKMTMKSFGSGKSTFNFYKADLGVQAISNSADIVVYPNPVADFITVQTELTIQNVSIIDLQGRILLTSEAGHINVQDLQSGIYMLLVQTESGLYQHTIIKQ